MRQSLKSPSVKVSVTNSVATLTGKVQTEAERHKATQLATIKGLARRTTSWSSISRRRPGTTGPMKSAAEKTKEGAETVADKTKEGLSKTGEVITDGWITTRVHSKFVGEDLLKDSDINVDTRDHVVTLKGTVMSAAGRARAVEQAREVEGVHRVIDQLVIGPKR